jgi:hypothetical protein
VRDLDGVFRDLINGYVGQGRKHQLPPAGHAAARSSKVWKIPQAGASVIDGSGNSPGSFGVVALDPFANALPILPPRASTNGLASRTQKPLKAPAHLLMSKVLAALQGFLSALHALDKAGIVLEIAGNNVLQQCVGITALLGCGMHQLRFEFRREMHFHGFGSFSENTVYAAAPGLAIANIHAGKCRCARRRRVGRLSNLRALDELQAKVGQALSPANRD